MIDHFVTDPFTPYEEHAFGDKLVSKELAMNEGMTYEIEIKYWRSAHSEFVPRETAMLFVRW